jgi:outer membrane protein assembly factor BamB
VDSEGSFKWSVAADTPSFSPAVGADGTVYFPSGDKLYALDGGDGSVRWACTMRLCASPAAIGDDGTVYVASSELNELYAISGDGRVRWVCDDMICDGLFTAPVVGTDGTVFIGTTPLWGDGRIYAVHTNGNVRWCYSTGFNGTPSELAVGSDGTVYAGTRGNGLHAINPDGSTRWKVDSPDNFGEPAVLSDGRLCVGLFDYASSMLVVIGEEGTQVVPVFASGDASMSWGPTIGSDGTVYVVTDNALYAVYWGMEWWHGARVRGSPALLADGSLIAAGDMEVFDLWATGDLMDSPWPVSRHDVQRTGRAAAGSAAARRGGDLGRRGSGPRVSQVSSCEADWRLRVQQQPRPSVGGHSRPVTAIRPLRSSGCAISGRLFSRSREMSWNTDGDELLCYYPARMLP